MPFGKILLSPFDSFGSSSSLVRIPWIPCDAPQFRNRAGCSLSLETLI